MAKVLIVEDEAILAMTTRIELLDMGHEVVGIANMGQYAIELAIKLKPEIILMDIVLLGNMNGIETTEEIYQHFDCKIIYMTAYTDENTLSAARKTKHAGVLFKPFESYQLQQILNDALN